MTQIFLAVAALSLALFAYAAVRWAEERDRDENLRYLLFAQEFCDELEVEVGRWGS